MGRIKVLVLRLTLKDVGFTLGWWLWLSRLGPKWVDASHTQTLHCAHLHNLPVALSVRIRFYDYIITIDWMQVVFISWVECVINMSALNTVSSGVLCKRYFYPSCKEEVSTSFGTLLSVVHPSTAGGSSGPSGVCLSLRTSAVTKSPSQVWKQAAHSGSCYMRLFEQRSSLPSLIRG